MLVAGHGENGPFHGGVMQKIGSKLLFKCKRVFASWVLQSAGAAVCPALRGYVVQCILLPGGLALPRAQRGSSW